MDIEYPDGRYITYPKHGPITATRTVDIVNGMVVCLVAGGKITFTQYSFFRVNNMIGPQPVDKGDNNVEPYTLWKHTNGGTYVVLMLTNEDSKDLQRYPVTVVYQGENSKLWSRPLLDWHRSMSFLGKLSKRDEDTEQAAV